VAVTFTAEMLLPSRITFITGALPHVRWPRARTTTADDAVRATAFDAVAPARRLRARPPDALPSRTVLPAFDGVTVIDSASNDAEFAAVAAGVHETVIATAATSAVVDTRTRAPRRANIGDSAG
jgi:hypothetical protein